jgi:hypothetical protein
LAVNPNEKATISNYSKYNEYSLSVDSFNRPLVFNDKDAVATLLVELIMLEPGTYPTRPYMGVGIVSKYRFSSMDELILLQKDIEDQIEAYLPEFVSTSVEISESDTEDKTINIAITIDEVVYTMVFDKYYKTLSLL